MGKQNPEPYAMGKCTICGREFRYLKAGYSGKYCSRKCVQLGQRKPGARITVACAACGKEFTRWVGFNPKYCSRKCAGVIDRRTTKKCLICGIEYSVVFSQAAVSVACSHACQVEWQKRYRRKRRLDSINRFGQKSWRRIRNEALERDAWTCQRCGAREGLHVHHLDPWVRTHDDSLDNLLTLCGACHFMADTEHRLNVCAEHLIGA